MSLEVMDPLEDCCIDWRKDPLELMLENPSSSRISYFLLGFGRFKISPSIRGLLMHSWALIIGLDFCYNFSLKGLTNSSQNRR